MSATRAVVFQEVSKTSQHLHFNLMEYLSRALLAGYVVQLGD